MYTSEELQDPHTSAARLAMIAQHHPETYPWIIAHPNCYLSLTQWLLQADPSLERYIPRISPTPTPTPPPAPPAPPAQPQQPTGPTPSSTGPKQAKRKRGHFVSIIAMILVVLMAGGAYALIGGRFRGAASPTLAVEKFLDGVMEENLMSLYGSLLPSDVDGVKKLLDGLTPIRASTTRSGRTTTEDPAERQDASQTLEEVQQAISITGEELEFDEQVIVEDQVARVTLTKGTISIGIDEQKAADLLLPLAETVIRANLEPSTSKAIPHSTM